MGEDSDDGGAIVMSRAPRKPGETVMPGVHVCIEGACEGRKFWSKRAFDEHKDQDHAPAKASKAATPSPAAPKPATLRMGRLSKEEKTEILRRFEKEKVEDIAAGINRSLKSVADFLGVEGKFGDAPKAPSKKVREPRAAKPRKASKARKQRATSPPPRRAPGGGNVLATANAILNLVDGGLAVRMVDRIELTDDGRRTLALLREIEEGE